MPWHRATSSLEVRAGCQRRAVGAVAQEAQARPTTGRPRRTAARGGGCGQPVVRRRRVEETAQRGRLLEAGAVEAAWRRWARPEPWRSRWSLSRWLERRRPRAAVASRPRRRRSATMENSGLGNPDDLDRDAGFPGAARPCRLAVDAVTAVTFGTQQAASSLKAKVPRSQAAAMTGCGGRRPRETTARTRSNSRCAVMAQ